MDFAATGLLDGLEGADRTARQQLLEQLTADGATLAELKAAVDEDRLALLPVERLLGGRYTAREVEERSGLSAAELIRFRRVLGLPDPGLDDREFSDEDVEAARSTMLFREAGLDQERLTETTRVLGEAMARVAAASVLAFVDAYLQPGDSEEDVARRFTTLTEELAPAIQPVLVSAYRQHLRESVRRSVLGRAERESGQVTGARELTVCFADLVGFTRLGGEVEIEKLGSVAGRLAELATDAIVEPVRLVKTIGDAAMFVSPDPGALVEVALSLVASVDQAELPSLRAGIAVGEALARSGDFYGPSINLASRVTGIARPGSVLCTEEVRARAPQEFAWSFAGRHRLKGIAEPLALYRARALEPDAAAERRPPPRQRAATRRREDRPRR